MKIMLKKGCILLLTIISIANLFILPTLVYADYKDEMSNLVSAQNTWSDDGTATTKVSDAVGSIISVVRVVGITVAVVMLLVVAMKYMTAAPGEKADIKKASVAYVIGALVLFGAVGILSIISAFSENI